MTAEFDQDVALFGRPAAILLQAREELRNDGWIAPDELRAMRPFDRALVSRHTLIAAVEDFIPWDGHTPRLVIAELAQRTVAHSVLGWRYEEIVEEIEAWENEPGRTFDDISQALVA